MSGLGADPMADDTGQEPGRMSDEEWNRIVSEEFVRPAAYRNQLRFDRSAILAALRTTREENERLRTDEASRVTSRSFTLAHERKERLALEAGLKALRDREARLVAALEMAWGIIANAGGGNWTLETPEWQEAAAKWRDKNLPLLASDSPPEGER